MHYDKNICQSVKTVRGNCKESWESYHRINIRQKTMMMIMLMMPVISTLLHHRLRARSVFEECAWGFSFREEGNAIQQVLPPHETNSLMNSFGRGQKSWPGKYILILFIFISFYVFMKSEIMFKLFSR